MNINQLKQEILNKQIPYSIAFILDGNGRWAKKRGMPRTYGHTKGIEALVKISEACHELGVKNVLVYAFSTENWSRPKEEVDFLMNALIENLAKYKKKLVTNQTRVKVIGERDNLPENILGAIEEVEELTKDFTSYTLGICFNYGGRQEIVHATKEIAKQVVEGKISIDEINVDLFEKNLYTNDFYDIDLMIRTSGEERLSNFLPWQLAYSEFIFTKCYWPDFNKKELYLAILEYQSRNRRFGGLENKNVK
jgi:undecaprenyl diphosphate synthase